MGPLTLSDSARLAEALLTGVVHARQAVEKIVAEAGAVARFSSARSPPSCVARVWRARRI